MRQLAASRNLFICVVLSLLTVVVLQGCSDDDDDNPVDPGAQSTQFTGFFVGHTDGGELTVTIPLASSALAPRLGGSATSHDVAVTGILTPDVGLDVTVNMTGTYSEETDSLYLTGTAPGEPFPYNMAGTYDPASSIPGITGHYQGPNDPGGFRLAVGGPSTVTRYCGETINDSETNSGRLNLNVVGSHVSGYVSMATGELGARRLYSFEGNLTGTAPNQSIAVYQVLGEQDPVEGMVLLMGGTLNATAGTITNGNWELELDGTATDSGTWQGSTNCEPTN